MRTRWLLMLVALVGLLVATSGISRAGADDGSALRTSLTGFDEVTPKLTAGQGTFRATIHDNTITYKLTYSGLTTTALFAHIHFAQPGVNGGIVAFLCGGGGKPACPATSGTVEGTITAADIQPVADQGVTAGDFAGVVRAIRSGTSYVNVHSTQFPAGELRGQIRGGSEAEDGDD
jgi:CHRD domain